MMFETLNALVIKRSELREEYRKITKELQALDIAIAQAEPSLRWECPINSDGCVRNCGNYGCGN